jgi:adenylate kinase family enzyme
MKVIVFGNLASGKSYLSDKIRNEIPSLEYLAVDDFRRKIGDGTMEKEIEAKQTFLKNIKLDKLQLIEATGLGDTGETIANILKESSELKFILILKTPLEICLDRLNTRIWDIPYPAPTKQAFKLAVTTDKLINEKTIQAFWTNAINCKIIELNNISDEELKEIIITLKNEL